VEKRNSRLTQRTLIVAILASRIDDGANPVLRRELWGAFGREAAADREPITEPMQIRLPCIAHNIIFFFNP
jgi:hypothetical protein